MAVNLQIPNREQVYPVKGVQIGIASAGIKKAGNRDLTLFVVCEGSTVAGVLTRNRFRAAPVQITSNHLFSGTPTRALIVNTGNANAGTGQSGLEKAIQMSQDVANALDLPLQSVLPFSTGVILEPLPIDKIAQAIPQAVDNLSEDQWFDAAYSIMTTDTQPKIHSSQTEIDGQTVTITGISKGAGMIRPNMATMLGYLATDAGIAQPILDRLVRTVANKSFNRISVDGDTSTNDCFMIMATGQCGLTIESEDDPRLPALEAALTDAALDLAQKIIRDGEGATKFITIKVLEAGDTEEALKVAYAVAHSPLVKTAFYASDPNLGRILAAIGYAGIDDLDVNNVSLWLDEVLVASEGGRDPNYQDADGQRVMQKNEIVMRIALGRGSVSETIYTCDLSHEYVSINADYRS
ncbi:bifunctional glutamate N-acetyltransferase/amino-acid acetyltransferase ArgJ [Orrella sp. 11846]|uniref:bifunctional glutamate N-acetyltransferase/amino-acid acetyltransferase ArgJ n=1 Tax=Orrella sp. 11846 TaxID=3409913 RepID=UPI003B5BCFE2